MAKKKIEYPIYEMEERASLLLPPHIIAQITYLHSHCGSDEWSGMLLYDVKKGNIADPENFVLEVKHIFLMDIGNGAFTDYEPDGDIVDIYDEFEEAMEWKTGHVHSHHNGKAYFSNVDDDELQDNVDKHNYYLSLVVNFSGNYAAKIVFLSDMKTSSQMSYIDDAGKRKTFRQSVNRRHMIAINMKILFGQLGGFFDNRYTEIRKKKEDAEKKKKKTHSSGYNYSNNHGEKKDPFNLGPIYAEKLAVALLLFDTELNQLGSLYTILNRMNAEEETSAEMWFDYILSHADMVMFKFFDTEELTVNGYKAAMHSVIERLEGFESISHLSAIVFNCNQVLKTATYAYAEDHGEILDDDEVDAELKALQEGMK
jgi:hypothetical protein